VETVSATDPDEGGNGQFRYSIESGDPDDQFAIDGKNASATIQGLCTLGRGNLNTQAYSTVNPTVHTNSSRKRSVSKTTPSR